MVAGIPSPVGGRLAITTQGSGILWQYDGTAAKWVVQNQPAFSDTTARNAAIPLPTVGITCVIGSGSSMAEYLWTGTVWQRRSIADIRTQYNTVTTNASGDFLIAVVDGGYPTVLNAVWFTVTGISEGPILLRWNVADSTKTSIAGRAYGITSNGAPLPNFTFSMAVMSVGT